MAPAPEETIVPMCTTQKGPLNAAGDLESRAPKERAAKGNQEDDQKGNVVQGSQNVENLLRGSRISLRVGFI